jgi:hypothetical protein
VTQLTNAAQGGLAEFNPFSEVGECAHSQSPVVLWVVTGSLGQRSMSEKEAALRSCSPQM